MTTRQRLLKLLYPLLMKFASKKNGNKTYSSSNNKPMTSIYDLNIELNDGTIFCLEKLKGKKIMIANTASNCGFTQQYEDLETLFQQHKNTLSIIAFPSNNFKNQEPENDEAIANFCKINYGISFLLAKKTIVQKQPSQHPVFAWLTDASKNGWNNEAPSWNFCKYLIDENGKLTHCFAPTVSPIDKSVLNAIK